MSTSKIVSNELFSFYKDVISAMQTDSLSLPQDRTIPMFALVGMQSSGKTTILTSLVGFPVGYSAGGTATRCPVRYVLQNDETERVMVNGRPVDKRQLPVVLQQHMDSIAPRFSSAIVEVHVFGPSVRDLIVLDLPGLKNEDHADHKEELDELVARFARSPQYTLICVTPFELVESSAHTRVFEQLMTDPVLHRVAAPRPDWKEKSIIVMTKCDAMNTRMHSAVELCEELQRHKSRDNKCIWLCMKPNRAYLQIDQAQEVEKNYEHMCTLLTDLKQNERSWVDEYVRSLDPTPTQLEAINRGLTDIFGMGVLEASLSNAWRAELLRALPDIKTTCEEQLRQLMKQRSEATRMSAVLDATELNRMFRDFSVDVVKHFCGLINGTEVENVHYREFHKTTGPGSPGTTRASESTKAPSLLEQLLEAEYSRPTLESMRHPTESDMRLEDAEGAPTSPSSSAVDLGLDKILYTSDKWGTSYDEDVGVCDAQWRAWQMYVDPDALFAELRLHPLGESLDQLELGRMSFERLYNIFSYMLLVCRVEEIADTDIDAMATSGDVREYNSANAIMSVARHKLRVALKGIMPLQLTIYKLFCRYVDVCFDFLLNGPRYAAIAECTPFLEIVRKAFKDVFTQSLLGVTERWQEDMNLIIDNLQVDAPARFMMGYLSTPLEQLVTPEQLSKIPSYKLPSEETRTVSKLGRYVNHERRDSHVGNTREGEKRAALIDVRENMRNHALNFNFADAVQGGLMRPWPMEFNDPDRQYIRRAACEYYYLAMNQVILITRARLTNKFVKAITSPDSSQYTTPIFTVLDSINASGLLLELTNVDSEKTVMIEQNLQIIQNRITRMQDILAKVARFQTPTRRVSGDVRRSQAATHAKYNRETFVASSTTSERVIEDSSRNSEEEPSTGERKPKKGWRRLSGALKMNRTRSSGNLVKDHA